MGPKLPKKTVAAPHTTEDAGDSVRKSVKFSEGKVYKLLQIIRALKPIWKDVEADFNALAASHPGFSQLPALSLKQKFALLCKLKKPTGDSLMPVNVLQPNRSTLKSFPTFQRENLMLRVSRLVWKSCSQMP